jgi:hypothetical protein
LEGGCVEAVASRFADLLAGEGLEPTDDATLAVLTPELLDALGLEDPKARRIVLTLRQPCEGRRQDRGQVQVEELNGPSLGKRGARTCPQPAESTPAGFGLQQENVPGFGRFQRRVFQNTGRRGPLAQEIVPGLFLGGFEAAQDTAEQRTLGITHIVNATSHQVSAEGREVLMLNLRDNDGDQDISKYFERVNRFIDEARDAGGSALVHCVRGVSRSSALVCAYVMTKSGFDVAQTLALVKRGRSAAQPRPGFMKQLKELERAAQGDPELPKSRPRRWKLGQTSHRNGAAEEA